VRPNFIYAERAEKFKKNSANSSHQNKPKIATAPVVTPNALNLKDILIVEVDGEENDEILVSYKKRMNTVNNQPIK
jgi:hypothetical protein